MKQVIRLTESDIKRLVMESAQRILNESENEWSIGDLRRPKSSRFSSQREYTPGQNTNMGASSTDSAVDNMNTFNDMSNPWSGFMNKVKGAVRGYKRGDEGMKNDQDMAELGNQYGVKRKHDSHGRVNMDKNNVAQRQFALVRDMEQDIEHDVEKFNLSNKTVDNALQYVTNDVQQKPQKFGLQSQEPVNDPEPTDTQAMVAEATRRVIRKYIK